MHLSAGNSSLRCYSFSLTTTCNTISRNIHSNTYSEFLSPTLIKQNYLVKLSACYATSKKSDLRPDSGSQDIDSRNTERKAKNTNVPPHVDGNSECVFPDVIPKKKKRGRRSEAAAVEDFVRDSLEHTFVAIRKQNSEALNDEENILKQRNEDEVGYDKNSDNANRKGSDSKGKKMVLEEEDPNWPVDADVGWGVRASDYFAKHSIKNVVGEDGVEIDWEGETDNFLVKEINCLEWESFAFHPSPLILLVFERYNRATDNWKALKELEKAAKVYWDAKNRLPPRTIKVDINIERDLAYALKVRECPQLLFLRGNTILYREKGITPVSTSDVILPCSHCASYQVSFALHAEMRTADELVHMIAHFYYNAKKPSWMT